MSEAKKFLDGSVLLSKQQRTSSPSSISSKTASDAREKKIAHRATSAPKGFASNGARFQALDQGRGRILLAPKTPLVKGEERRNAGKQSVTDTATPVGVRPGLVVMEVTPKMWKKLKLKRTRSMTLLRANQRNGK